jgi:hypothetical protein
MQAITGSFGGQVDSLSQTPVILIRKDTEGKAGAVQFAYGQSSTKPWGLPLPDCPKCGVSSNLEGLFLQSKGIVWECIPCKMQTSNFITKPDWVENADKDGNCLVNHWIYPFPTPPISPPQWERVPELESDASDA